MIRTGVHIGYRFGSDSETYAGARDRELEARRRALGETRSALRSSEIKESEVSQSQRPRLTDPIDLGF